jgi:hypothetical protein
VGYPIIVKNEVCWGLIELELPLFAFHADVLMHFLR